MGKIKLTDFVWFQRGFDLPKDKFIEGNIPVLGSSSILRYHNETKVKEPGIVTGRSGTLGSFQYSNVDFWPHNKTLWVKDFKGNDPKFAYYLLKCLDFSLFNSGGAVSTLNRNVLSVEFIIKNSSYVLSMKGSESTVVDSLIIEFSNKYGKLLSSAKEILREFFENSIYTLRPKMLVYLEEFYNRTW